MEGGALLLGPRAARTARGRSTGSPKTEAEPPGPALQPSGSRQAEVRPSHPTGKGALVRNVVNVRDVHTVRRRGDVRPPDKAQRGSQRGGAWLRGRRRGVVTGEKEGGGRG